MWTCRRLARRRVTFVISGMAFNAALVQLEMINWSSRALHLWRLVNSLAWQSTINPNRASDRPSFCHALSDGDRPSQSNSAQTPLLHPARGCTCVCAVSEHTSTETYEFITNYWGLLYILVYQNYICNKNRSLVLYTNFFVNEYLGLGKENLLELRVDA